MMATEGTGAGGSYGSQEIAKRQGGHRVTMRAQSYQGGPSGHEDDGQQIVLSDLYPLGYIGLFDQKLETWQMHSLIVPCMQVIEVALRCYF